MSIPSFSSGSKNNFLKKYLITLPCLVLLILPAYAQKTALGGYNGNGGAYVPPVVYKTYKTYDGSYKAPESVYNKSGTTTTTYTAPTGNNKPDNATGSTSIPVRKGSPYNKSHYYLTAALTPVADYGMYGFADPAGIPVIPFKYVCAYAFAEGRAAVSRDGKQTYIDEAGIEIMPFIYDSCTSFSDNYAAVSKNNLWGYIDKKGAISITLQYAAAQPFSEKFAAVKINDKWGYINTSGTLIIPCIYTAAGNYSEGLATVTITDNGANKTGFIDAQGTLIIPCNYEAASAFTEGVAGIKRNGKWGFIDKAGTEVIEAKYASAGFFSEGLAAVQDVPGGLWGYINKSGQEVIGKSYSYPRGFHEGLAAVEINHLTGFINPQGDMVIKANLDFACGDFEHGVAVVYKNGRPMRIDKTGKEIHP